MIAGLLALATVSCGRGIGGVIFGGGGSSGHGSLGPLFRVEILPIPRQDGDIQIDVLVRHRNSQPIDLVLEYSDVDQSGPYLPATIVGSDSGMIVAPDTVQGLTSSKPGVMHFLVWDSLGDTGPSGRTVWIRITPISAASFGKMVMSPDTIIGNDPPGVSVVPVLGPATGEILVDFDLEDTTYDPVDLTVEYTIDGGGVWLAATISTGLTLNLATAPSPGLAYQVGWDSLADLGTGTFNTEIRIIPCDDETGVVECGLAGFTGTFQVMN